MLFLFVASDFLVFVLLLEGACDEGMLVLLYVFICLQIFSLWVCTICRRQFKM